MACSDINNELEKFITTLYTCESAVYLDASPMRKQTLKKYLLSVVMPISTIRKALGFNDSVEKINLKLKQYVSVSDFHCVLEDDF